MKHILILVLVLTTMLVAVRKPIQGGNAPIGHTTIIGCADTLYTDTLVFERGLSGSFTIDYKVDSVDVLLGIGVELKYGQTNDLTRNFKKWTRVDSIGAEVDTYQVWEPDPTTYVLFGWFGTGAATESLKVYPVIIHSCVNK